MKIDIKFLKRYLSKVVREIISELQDMGKTRWDAYYIIDDCILHREIKRLDSIRGEGDSLYLIASVLGLKFWFLLANQVERCVELDAKAGNLRRDEEIMIKTALKRKRESIPHPENMIFKFTHSELKLLHPTYYR